MHTPDNVFEYNDYRAFLRDYYSAKKAAGRGFSYRAFSRWVGVRAPNHLKRVMDGDRNLGLGTARRYAEVIGLEGEQLEYFCDLVSFNQAKTSTTKQASYERLIRFRAYRKAHRLEVQHAQYHAHWYVPAIHEMVVRDDFVLDPAWIAKQLLPAITQQQASAALDVLFALKLIEANEEGTVRQVNQLLSTGPETLGVHIGSYHREMIRRAVESIDLVGGDSRDISSVTLSIPEDGIAQLKELIASFRKQVIDLATEGEAADRVVQVNVQLFPLTQRRKGDKPL